MKPAVLVAVFLVSYLVLSSSAYAMFTSSIDISYGIFKPKIFNDGFGFGFFYRGFTPQISTGGFSFRFRFVDP